MTDFVAGWLVGKPLNILLVSGLFMALHLLIRSSSHGGERRQIPTLAAALAWGAYAAWEWLVQVWTPEANIRIDLLGIWLLLAILSGWALVASRKRKEA